jgi:hypothetical protein
MVLAQRGCPHHLVMRCVAPIREAHNSARRALESLLTWIQGGNARGGFESGDVDDEEEKRERPSEHVSLKEAKRRVNPEIGLLPGGGIVQKGQMVVHIGRCVGESRQRKVRFESCTAH